MNQPISAENKIKCGRCNTEFDLHKNSYGCPLCGFGRDIRGESKKVFTYQAGEKAAIPFRPIDIPPSLDLKPGKISSNMDTKAWGSWVMFNDFFAPKFLARVTAWKLYKEEIDYVQLSALMKDAINIIDQYDLSRLKGFPNLKKDWSGSRLVDHFLLTFAEMGLFEVIPTKENVEDVWKEEWADIKVTLTKEGLEFAQIRNPIFDDDKTEQVLSLDEKNWLLDYLKKIDSQEYREYSTLKEIYDFLKEGHNGNEDLLNWFVSNEKYQKHVLERSKRAQNDEGLYKRQLWNYARSFASAKLSLLRELGAVKNKRGSYTIVGEI